MSDPASNDTPVTPTHTGSHGGKPGDRTADLHHNQDTKVRQSGDQPPEATAAPDRDRQKTPGINPGS